jgi:hypothetical protein
MAQLITRPQRFTIDEWKIANKVKHKNAERDRSNAERLMSESDRLSGETKETCDTNLADVNKKLGETFFESLKNRIKDRNNNNNNNNNKILNKKNKI